DQGIYSNKEGINDIEIFKILEKSSLYNHYDVIGANQIFKDVVSEILGSLRVQSDISPSDYFVPHNPFYAFNIKLLALQMGEALDIPLLEEFSLDHLLLRENVEWQEDYPDTIRQLFEKKETLPEETLQFLLNVMVSRCFQKLPGLINANRFPLNELRSEVERSLQFRYLGPLRPAPRKFYSGDALWTELFYPSVHDSDKLVTKYLNIMGLEYDFKKMKVSSSNDLHSLVLVDRKNKYRSNYADMGFGFSQIMPIIFSRLQGGITIIEQPELHLHPKAQSKLALLFAYDLVFVKKHAENDMTRIIAHPSEERLIYIGKFEYDKIAAIPITDTTFRNSGTVIIETHSEHLIRGLQLQVAKGIISSRNIALYYVGKNKDGSSSVEQIEMSEKGTFATDWPGELFEDGFRQASELLSLN
ncbi:MAG: AAA family ATPase, partial [Candidatus Marinimicrobia bacterium]|nr:AAA family ATPase [Candidatus Neomarinimicrobiota bacterium]